MLNLCKDCVVFFAPSAYPKNPVVEDVICKQGETEMAEKGKKDKARREQQKKAKLSLKEKRKLKREKKKE